MTRSTVLLLSAFLLAAGCVGSKAPDPIKTKYYDADRRFGQTVDGGFADLREISIPRTAKQLTLRASFVADEGIGFTFRDPDGVLVRSVSFSQAAAAHELQWVEAAPPKDGTWRFGITCERYCEYAFGFYFSNAVEPREGLATRYVDATKRFADSTDGATTLTREFMVPSNTTSLDLKWSAFAKNGLSFAIRDPNGGRRLSMSFPSQVAVDDLQFHVVDDPRPGPWTFTLACEHACDYAYGFYLDH